MPSPRSIAPPRSAPDGTRPGVTGPIPAQRHGLAVRPLADCEPPPDQMVEEVTGPAEACPPAEAATSAAEPGPPTEAGENPTDAGSPAEAAEGTADAPDPAGVNFRVVAHAVARRVVTGVIEVLDGRRPVAQLRGLLSEQVYAALQTRVRTGCRGPARRLHRVHICHPAAGVAEVSATFGNAHRTHAVALRLECRAGGWRCTALRVL
ncbi:Rv3235 family protein [Gandjariella thermophila]|uniref:Uncharacterized protein n=1 Tax=Gandjariella thermophila TaxID=1931992 RepID=A0A4D4J9X1_9PSEU|nr:Rv3235 family protein [Gandjariella thermophila]GDY31286.1 hypothetical protein GTS_29190 [Gandjariella thermophila]